MEKHHEKTHPHKKLSIKEALSFGWSTTKSNIPFFIGVLLITFAVNYTLTFVRQLFPEDLGGGGTLLFALLSLGMWIVTLEVQIGTMRLLLKFYDGKAPVFADLFSAFEKTLLSRYFVGSVLYGLAVILGLIFLVLPGIVLAIRFSFYGYLIVDKNLKPIEAFKKSWEITSGHAITLLVFGLLIMVINIAGALLLMVGLFVTIPVSMLSAAFLYRKLSS